MQNLYFGDTDNRKKIWSKFAKLLLLLVLFSARLVP